MGLCPYLETDLPARLLLANHALKSIKTYEKLVNPSDRVFHPSNLIQTLAGARG
jgi:hypothetical protein